MGVLDTYFAGFSNRPSLCFAIVKLKSCFLVPNLINQERGWVVQVGAEMVISMISQEQK